MYYNYLILITYELINLVMKFSDSVSYFDYVGIFGKLFRYLRKQLLTKDSSMEYTGMV